MAKSSYRARTGHERSESRVFHKSRGLAVTKRRKGVIERLETQLKDRIKFPWHKNSPMAEEKDIARITTDLEILKQRI